MELIKESKQTGSASDKRKEINKFIETKEALYFQEDLINDLQKELIFVIDKYYDNLYRLSVLITASSNDAEDALQEAFLSAVKALSKFRGNSSLYTWLYRIVINKAKDVRNRNRKNDMPSLNQHDFDFRDKRFNVEKNIEDNETTSLLIEKINELQDIYREIIFLRYFENLSYQDISKILNIREGTVKSRLFKAKKQLKKKLLLEQEKNPHLDFDLIEAEV